MFHASRGIGFLRNCNDLDLNGNLARLPGLIRFLNDYTYRSILDRRSL